MFNACRISVYLLSFQILLINSCSRTSTNYNVCSPKIVDNKWIIRIGIPQKIVTDDINKLHHLITYQSLANVYEPLLITTSNMEYIPVITKYWEFIDDRTISFSLRENIYLHNGKPLTGQILKNNYVRYLTPPVDNSIVIDPFLISNLDDITVEDNVLTVKLKQGDYYALVRISNLSLVVEQNGKKIGTGPYFIKEYLPEKLKLAKFTNHWSSSSSSFFTMPDEIEFIYFPDLDSMEKAFRRCELDFLHLIPAQLFTRLSNNKNYVANKHISLGVYFLRLEDQVKPLDIKEVREAIELAIDKNRIVTEIALGYGIPANQIFPPTVVGFNPDLPPSKYDPLKAKELLEQAGYKNGFSLDIYSLPDKHIEPLVEMLRKIGIKLTPKFYSMTKLSSIEPDKVGVYYGGFWFINQISMWNCCVRTEDLHALDIDTHRMSETIHLLEQLRLAQTVSDMKKVFFDLANILNEEKFVIPLYYPYYLSVHHNYLEWNFNPMSGSSPLEGKLFKLKVDIKDPRFYNDNQQ